MGDTVRTGLPGPAPDPTDRLIRPRPGGARRLSDRSTRLMVAAMSALVIVSVLTTVLAGAASPTASVVNHLAQLVASAAATGAAAALAAHRPRVPLRPSALLAAVGCGLWFGGELVWFVSDWVVRIPLPDVSPVDLLFLAFPLLLALSVWLPLRQSMLQRLRMMLDALIIAASLFVISWVVLLTHLARWSDRPDGLATLVVSLAYPCADIVALTVLLLGIAQFRTSRALLAGAAAAMALVAAADMTYAYRTVVSDFAMGTPVDLGWIVGFGILAVLWTRARSWPPSADPAAGSGATATPPGAAAGDRVVAGMLPYVPVLVALVAVAARRLVGTTEIVGEMLIIVILGLVLLRQYLTLCDNRNLTSDLAARERDLRQQAYHDVLTGLPNRALFGERVARAVEQHRRDGRPLALLFIDLDDFKAVNDTLGHPVGDELVSRVGARLRRQVRATDTVSRFGGDEFAVLVEGDHDAVAMADRLAGELRRPFALRVRSLAISCSIGVAQVRADDETPGVDELFSRADIAMYAAKRAGKGQVSAHHPAMVLPEADDLHFRPLLIDDLGAGRIACVFQPIVCLSTRRLVSLEALARWVVDGRQIDQTYFIGLVGRSGLLPGLTDHMIDQAAGHLAAWNERFGCSELKVSVNVPPGLMSDRGFPARVVTILERHGVGCRQLALEITEDALLGDYRTTQVVARRFRELGIEVWLDDFGSGYSSLLSLRRIALQSVKIDLEFVANIHRDPEAEQFLGAMLRLTRELGLVVTAEGVELPEQADILTALGCTYAQGFLYSEPVPAPEIDIMLRRGDLTHPVPFPPREPAPASISVGAGRAAAVVGGPVAEPLAL